jgi:hypothetical protein
MERAVPCQRQVLLWDQRSDWKALCKLKNDTAILLMKHLTIDIITRSHVITEQNSDLGL